MIEDNAGSKVDSGLLPRILLKERSQWDLKYLFDFTFLADQLRCFPGIGQKRVNEKFTDGDIKWAERPQDIDSGEVYSNLLFRLPEGCIHKIRIGFLSLTSGEANLSGMFILLMR